jgi:hypothetical protein
MEIEEFKKRLRGYKKSDILFTKHTEIRALHRDINLEEVKENIVSPDKLVFVRQQENNLYECYFAYSSNFSHKYVLTLNGKVLIVTIISINRDWQKTIKK